MMWFLLILSALLSTCWANQDFVECNNENPDYNVNQYCGQTWYLLKSTDPCDSECKTYYSKEKDNVLTLITSTWTKGTTKNVTETPLARISDNSSKYLFSILNPNGNIVGIRNIAEVRTNYYVDFTYLEGPSVSHGRIDIFGTDPSSTYAFSPKKCGKNVHFNDCKASINCV